MGGEGEGSGGRGGGKWGERGREVGIRYPPVHPLIERSHDLLVKIYANWTGFCLKRQRCEN